MAAPTPLTELEAVNEMLYDAGLRDTTSTSSTRRDVIIAVSTLDKTLLRLLNRGWWFNEEEITLSENGAGKYAVDSTWSHVEVISGGPTSGTDGTPVLVVRGGFLYDVVNNTDTFSVGDPDVKLLIRKFLDYESDSIPSVFRDYVYLAATVRFQRRILGSGSVDEDLKADMVQAWSTLQQEELDQRTRSDLPQTYSAHFYDMMHDA